MRPLRRRAPTHETADVDGRRIWIVAGRSHSRSWAPRCSALAHCTHSATKPADRSRFINPTPTHAPTPSLQSAPTTDLRALRAEKHALLDEYRWIDRDKGIVRIPIERAMALLIARTPPAAQ